MALAQVVEHLADVEVLLHRGAEQLEARVARKLLDLVAANKGKTDSRLIKNWVLFLNVGPQTFGNLS